MKGTLEYRKAIQNRKLLDDYDGNQAKVVRRKSKPRDNDCYREVRNRGILRIRDLRTFWAVDFVPGYKSGPSLQTDEPALGMSGLSAWL